jgi:hypothetical protein
MTLRLDKCPMAQNLCEQRHNGQCGCARQMRTMMVHTNQVHHLLAGRGRAAPVAAGKRRGFRELQQSALHKQARARVPVIRQSQFTRLKRAVLRCLHATVTELWMRRAMGLRAPAGGKWIAVACFNASPSSPLYIIAPEGLVDSFNPFP